MGPRIFIVQANYYVNECYLNKIALHEVWPLRYLDGHYYIVTTAKNSRSLPWPVLLSRAHRYRDGYWKNKKMPVHQKQLRIESSNSKKALVPNEGYIKKSGEPLAPLCLGP